MEKEKALAQIYAIMRQNELDADDVRHYVLQNPEDYNTPKIGDEFDLLCLIEGQEKRVLFSQRHLGKPLGIFPFKNKPEYIELDELKDKKHIEVDVKRLLDEKFCNQVYDIKNQLNVYLQALNKPILQGEYLADSSYMPGCGWIVGFDENKTGKLSSDYYGGTVPAKLRYMGRYTKS